ncbi:PepSY domain-containing protein [Thermococcus sp.]|uniref:PepSY domain-containing protein n=1 Tax=Thermococcus sp. TaxID=35749 RepID=UPI0026248179|nr:PepSY domain-containing protein [Thermococcus sp.]
MRIRKFNIGLKVAALIAALIMAVSIGAFAMAASTAPANATGKNVQPPSYTGSIKIAQNSNLSESQEAKALQKLAKITPKQAESAALAKVNGTAIKVGLDNENGYLVYSVEVKTAKGLTKDVKVDAGNGKVLHIDSGSDIEKESKGEPKEESSGEATNTDSINDEVQEGEEN